MRQRPAVASCISCASCSEDPPLRQPAGARVRWRVGDRARDSFAITVDRGDGAGFKTPPRAEIEAALALFSRLDSGGRVSAAGGSGETPDGSAGERRPDVPSGSRMSQGRPENVPSGVRPGDGPTEPETYRDRAGRLYRRHFASVEARRARNARARDLHARGRSIREIAQELAWSRGTVERAIKTGSPASGIIRGERVGGKAHVTVDGRPLEWRASLEVASVSPPGIDWGLYGPGPLQLALAILMAVTDRKEAVRHFPRFRNGCIAGIDERRRWTIMTAGVRDWLAQARRTRGPVHLQVRYVRGASAPSSAI